MEQAAAEDAAADGRQQQAAVRDVHRPSLSNICSTTDQQAIGKTINAKSAALGAAGSCSEKKQQPEQFSVGPSVDASYVASQRLLTMAGVRLRQHTLQRSISIGKQPQQQY
jgi:hypothetical protein